MLLLSTSKCFRNKSLRKVMTSECNSFISEGAKLLRDSSIMSKTSERCDLISLDAFYYISCYTSFRNKVRSKEKSETNKVNFHKSQMENVAFSGLISYIKECKDNSDTTRAFSMIPIVRYVSEISRKRGTPSVKLQGCYEQICLMLMNQVLV